MTSGAQRICVLFVCTGNTCRSVLAEYIARDEFGDSASFESAGIKPQQASDSENAVYTLRATFNIDASRHVPRDVRLLDLNQFALIIALENPVAKVLEGMGVAASKIKTWQIKDPYGPDLTEYDRACVQLKREILRLKDSIAH